MPKDDLSEIVSDIEPSGVPDTQPQANIPERRRRVWVPSEWAAPGEGGGAPKLSGGYEADIHSGVEVPRSLNRPDQRYALASDELQSRRVARAAAELSSTVILRNEEGGFDVRSPSGNNYDVTASVDHCDCPDFLRLQQSDRSDVMCKHQLMVASALAAEVLGESINWSAAKAAQEAGIAVETVRQACAKGLISAFKRHEVWCIPPFSGQLLGLIYTRYVPVILGVSPSRIPAGSPDTQVSVTGSAFTPFSQVIWNGEAVLSSVPVPVLPLTLPADLAFEQVTCAIPSALLTTPGVYNLRVENAYRGGATSDPVTFIVE